MRASTAGELVYLERYDIGVAVQTEQGLVVPVVRECDSPSLDELNADAKRLADAAQRRQAHAGGPARRHVHASRAPANRPGH